MNCTAINIQDNIIAIVLVLMNHYNSPLFLVNSLFPARKKTTVRYACGRFIKNNLFI